MTEKATLSDYRESAAFLRRSFPVIPEIAIVLGSGLGDYAAQLTRTVTVPYAEIPHFPLSTVSYQKGELVFGYLGEIPVLAMNGRFHYYEGWEMWQTAYPVAVFKLLGVKRLILTNAAGGISPDYASGALVVVRDHIKLSPDSPLRGSNLSELGERFFDMQTAYSPALCELALQVAKREQIPLSDGGIYVYMTGPQYETPAEIRMLSRMGATLVGMSTVPEVIAAAHCALPVLCISCVTNQAAGVSNKTITSEEVLETGAKIARRFTRLISAIITAFAEEESHAHAL